MIYYFRVYGKDGHRQRKSFSESMDFTTWSGVKVKVYCSDCLFTNDYCVVSIEQDGLTFKKAQDHLDVQICDGVFENCNCGVNELLNFTNQKDIFDILYINTYELIKKKWEY